MGRERDTNRNEPELRPAKGAGRAAGRALLVALAMLCAAAFAAEAETPDASGAATAAALPRGAAEPSHDRPYGPSSPLRWATRSDYAGGNYRWAASRGALDFGLRFGTVRAAVPEPHLDAAGPMVSNLPSLSLGLRTVTPNPTAASSLLERAIGAGAATARSSSFGIEWKPAQSQVAFVRQGLGIRLGGDERLTMQLRKGTLGIYMKRDF